MPAGRPLTYQTVEQLQAKIDEYFNSRKTPLLDGKGRPCLDENENVIMVDAKPCTVTGLALFLGFSGRQALLNYQGREEFMDAVTRAKSRIEEYAEERLYDKDGCNGAKFNLTNNFGWVERQEVTNTNLDIALESSERRAQLISMLQKPGIIEGVKAAYEVLPESTSPEE
jgi:hypothetical protein